MSIPQRCLFPCLSKAAYALPATKSITIPTSPLVNLVCIFPPVFENQSLTGLVPAFRTPTKPHPLSRSTAGIAYHLDPALTEPPPHALSRRALTKIPPSLLEEIIELSPRLKPYHPQAQSHKQPSGQHTLTRDRVHLATGQETPYSMVHNSTTPHITNQERTTTSLPSKCERERS